MKNILFIFMLLPIFGYAQTGTEPVYNFDFPCENYFYLGDTCINDHVFKGDQCFGYGAIPATNSFEDYKYMNLKRVAVSATVNMIGNRNVYTSSFTSMDYIIMDGNDTIFVADQLNIYNLISFGNNNVIMLVNGGLLYMDQDQKYAGDIINNNIQVLACINNNIPVTFKKLYKENGNLYWDVNSEGQKIVVEYASHTDSTRFSTVLITPVQQGFKKMEYGYYRLIVGVKTSKIIHNPFPEYQLVTPIKYKGIYDMAGKRYTILPTVSGLYYVNGKIVRVL